MSALLRDSCGRPTWRTSRWTSGVTNFGQALDILEKTRSLVCGHAPKGRLCTKTSTALEALVSGRPGCWTMEMNGSSSAPYLARTPCVPLFCNLFFFQTAKSMHHPHKIDDQHRECKIGGCTCFAFFLGSGNSHTTTPKLPPDEEGLLWGWYVFGGPLFNRGGSRRAFL